MTQGANKWAIGTSVLEHASDEAPDMLITARISRIYSILQPNKSFVEDFYRPIFIAAANGDPAELSYQYCVDADHTQYTFKAHLTLLTKACYWAITGDAAKDASDRDMELTSIANAQYYIGFAEGLISMDDVIPAVISARSTSGAKKRDEKFGPLRELARELAAKKYYASKRQAALGIKDVILAEAEKASVNLSEMQAERTITGWLEGMSFGSKRQP